MADFTSPEAKKLNSIINKLQNEIATLKGGGTTPQLTSSSIDVNEGRGYIPVIENGEIKMRIGRQPDGSTAIVSENNPVPPVMPYMPLCVSLLGGVQVRCQGFVNKQFADFSHVKVYRDMAYYGSIIKVPGSIVVSPLSPGDHQFRLSSVNLSGTESPLTEATICAPKQAIAEDIADGIITTLKIANDAITEAKIAVDAITAEQIADGSVVSDKIAANAITASKVAAAAIQAGAIAANAISSDKIAANAITSDKIAANAITALQIAANAITSTKIDAGAIDATKLAAQLILASTQIIVGNLTGARLVLDSQGLTQFDTRGNLAVQFGAQANKSNFLTIVDPADPTNTLASIANDGSIAMTGITINGKAKLNGIDLVQYLNSLPRGIVAYGTMPSNTAFYGQGVPTGIFELQFDAQAGKKYKICTSGLSLNQNAQPPTAQSAYMSLRYTTNGSIPTVNSTNPYMATWFGSAYSTTNDYVIHGQTTPQLRHIFAPSTSGRARILYVLTFYDGSSFNAGTNAPGSMLGPVDYWIEDLGSVVANTGGANPGGGTSQANGAYITTWPCSYSAYAYDTNTSVYPDPHPNDLIFAGTYCGQLNGTNYYSRLDFNWPNIQSTLAGSTIYKTELYLYSYYWTLATGGWVSLGWHNSSSIGGGGGYQYVGRNVNNLKMAKPEGSWLEISNGFGVGFRDGWLKGIVLDNRESPYNNSTNYGQFRRGAGYDGEDVQPVLRVTYTK